MKPLIGDLVIHKFRGQGRVCPSEIYNADPTSLMVLLDDDPTETVELTLSLIEKVDE